jgi:2-octaprenyl-6-methoxyphenol hydroxylase
MNKMADSICIIGGGPAGCCMALLLAQQGWPTHVIEAGNWSAEHSEKSERTLALSQSSWDVLAEIGIAPQDLNAQAIRSIHVSQRGMPGQVLLSAEDAGKDAFGYTVSYQALLTGLRNQIQSESLITVESNSRVLSIEGSNTAARISYQSASSIRHSILSALSIVADGGAEIDDPRALNWSYGTEALSCQITSLGAKAGLAWERFTPEGPIALLPSAQGLALIWTGSSARIQDLCNLNDQLFLSALQDWFGDRAGCFVSASPRIRYPLKSRFSLRPAQHRVIRIANAAQTLHPVAGQGFNLGLRDVAQLRNCLGLARSQDPGHASILNLFSKERRADRWLTGGLTHLLAQGFTLPIPGARGLGSFALSAMDITPSLRDRFARLMSDGLAV